MYLRPKFLILCCVMIMFIWAGAGVASAALVSEVNVEGNQEVVTKHILGAVRTKVGDTLDQEQVKEDVEAIYDLGFFSFADARFNPSSGGVAVTFVVRENPIVESVNFEGNTVYNDEQLNELVFTAPGTVFNRVFFRHDLRRIKEKYDDDGYVMMKIADVQIEQGNINVSILEPKIGDVIIQGNTKTKSFVIERQIKFEKGDLFNATILRHSINKINSLGYFEDVSVGFEPSEESSEYTNIIITVQETKTGNIGLTIGHGSSSGWSGGISYGDTNWAGKGHKAEIGFELGDNEQYWVYYQEPYMDGEHFAWKIGAYKKFFEEREFWDENQEQFEFDEDRTGGYIGFGKKFPNDEKLSWYLNLDWRDTEISNVNLVNATENEKDDYLEENFIDGTIFSTPVTFTYNNLDPYLSYPDGDVEEVTIEKAWEVLGGEYDFAKYWGTVKYYVPITGIGDIFDLSLGTEDNPTIFASRIRAGFSSGTIPFVELYEVGGSKTLRGYEDDYRKGDEMILGNFEIRVPIDNNFKAVVFYDTGNAWNTSDGEDFSFSDLYDSYGFGIRVKTPLGNLRVDYGEGEDESKTHFGFGEMF